jgi:hypothetical protein
MTNSRPGIIDPRARYRATARRLRNTGLHDLTRGLRADKRTSWEDIKLSNQCPSDATLFPDNISASCFSNIHQGGANSFILKVNKTQLRAQRYLQQINRLNYATQFLIKLSIKPHLVSVTYTRSGERANAVHARL